MAKKKPQEKEEVYYVGVQDPIEVRRSLLELSKDMVQFLQQNEKLKTVRDNKMDAYKRMRDDIHQIKTLINKLRLVMPKTKLRIQLHPVKKPAVHHHKKKASAMKFAPAQEKQATLAPQPRKPSTEIEKLESELADIENKLGRL